MRGVLFNYEDLKALQPKIFRPPADKIARGRPPEIENKDAIWLALLDMLYDKADPAASFSTKDAFRLEMLQNMQERRGTKFGEKACRDVASEAFDRLSRHGAV